MDDAQAMQRCIDLAREAVERGDQPFGSVIVMDGKIIAEDSNRVSTDIDPTAHAELLAVRKACQQLGHIDLSGATIYASGEPCWMCSSVIRSTQISRVVVAMRARYPTGGATSGHPLLSLEVPGLFPAPKVEVGFMEDDVRTLQAEYNWPPEPKE